MQSLTRVYTDDAVATMIHVDSSVLKLFVTGYALSDCVSDSLALDQFWIDGKDITVYIEQRITDIGDYNNDKMSLNFPR